MLNSFFSLLSQFIPLIITFVLAGASYWLAARGEIDLFGRNQQHSATEVDYYIDNFHAQSQELASQKLSMLEGTHAKHFPVGDHWRIEKPTIKQFQETGVKILGTAESANYMPAKELLTLENTVEIKSTRNGATTVLTTDKLQIDNATSTISTDSEVLVTRPGQHIQSHGMQMNQKTGEIKSQGRIKMKLEAKQ